MSLIAKMKKKNTDDLVTTLVSAGSQEERAAAGEALVGRCVTVMSPLRGAADAFAATVIKVEWDREGVPQLVIRRHGTVGSHERVDPVLVTRERKRPINPRARMMFVPKKG